MSEDNTNHKAQRWGIQVCFFYYVVHGLMGPGLLPPIHQDIEQALGFSHSQFGILLSSSAIAMALMSVVGGVLCDRITALRVMIWACGLTALSAALLWYDWGVGWFVALFVLFGAFSGLTVAINPLGAAFFGDDGGRMMSALHGVQGVGRLLAPGVVSAFVFLGLGWRNLFIVSAVLHLVCVIMFLSMQQPASLKQTSQGENVSLRKNLELLRSPIVLMCLGGFFFCAAGEMLLINWLPLMLEGEFEYSKAYAMWGFGGLMGGYTAIRLLPLILNFRLNSKLAVVLVLLHVVCLGVLCTNPSIWLVTLTCVGIGISFGLHWPSTISLVYAVVPQHQHGFASSAAVCASIAGIFSLNIVFGFFADVYGVASTIWMVPGCFMLFTLFFVWAGRLRA